jgi:hypothetical protein
VGHWESDSNILGTPEIDLTLNSDGSYVFSSPTQHQTLSGKAEYENGYLKLGASAEGMKLQISQSGANAFVCQSQVYPNGKIDATPYSFHRKSDNSKAPLKKTSPYPGK